MSKNKLSLLTELILSLSKQEFQNLKNYLRAFNTKYGKYEPISVQIVDEIKKGNNLQLPDLKERISPSVSHSSFDKSILRLYNKCLDALTTDVYTNASTYAPQWKIRWELRRHLTSSEILQGKGLLNHTITILDNALNKAKKYELYTLFLEVAYERLNHYAIEGNEAGLNTLAIEIETIESFKLQINKAKLLYQHSAAREAWKVHPLLKKQLQKELKELESEKSYFTSDTFFIWYALSKLNYLEESKSHTESLQLSGNVLKRLKPKSPVYTPRWEAVFSLYKGSALLHLLQFEKALPYFDTCIAFFGSNSPTALVALNHKFHAAYHAKNYPMAFSIQQELLSVTRKQKKSRQYTEQIYYRSCIHFLRKHHRHSLADLNQTSELDDDREGWNLNIRILTIMNLIELKKFDEADRYITNLYQLLNTLSKVVEVKPRYIVIYKTLNILKKTGYQFKKAESALHSYLKLLGSRDLEYAVEIMKPELIAVDKWFLAHLKGMRNADITVSFAA